MQQAKSGIKSSLYAARKKFLFYANVCMTGEESSLVKLSSVESLASSSSLPDSCLAWLCVACDSVIRVESGCVLAVRALGSDDGCGRT